MKLAYYTREEVMALARRLRIGSAHPGRQLTPVVPATIPDPDEAPAARYLYGPRPGADQPDLIRRRAAG
jgi:hypothetical protein